MVLSLVRTIGCIISCFQIMFLLSVDVISGSNTCVLSEEALPL